MAKEIKVIKCPNCGSVNKTEIKLDFYRCNSCQTEYFLDNNDVNINYNHNYNHSNSFNTNEKTIKIIGIALGGIFALFVLIFIITSIFSSSKKSKYSYTTASSTTKEKEEEDNTYHASRYASLAFLQPSNQQPIVIMLESRRYNSHMSKDQRDGSYLAFYDPIKKTMLKEEKVSDESLSTSDFKFREFSDGNVYMVNHKSAFLRLDKENLKAEDVGKKFFNANPELQIGVATMEFVYDDNGDGLVLLTNDGKERYYYPLIQKLYTKNQYYDANNGFSSLLPNAKDKTIHVFTEESSDYPDERIQLLQLTYKDNGAGPKDIIDSYQLKWHKDYGGSGIFTDRDPYRKTLVGGYTKDRCRITNWKDVTPERLYFAPDVLLDDKENLIIQFRADANTKSNYKFQKLNRQTAAIEWTFDVPNGKKIEQMIKYKNGFVCANSEEEMILLDVKGNVKSTYKLD